MGIALKAGGNFVVYTGQAQLATEALASIESYLNPKGGHYYWNNVTGLYEAVTYTTVMMSYGCYWIEVIQDCTWTYGPEATAPTSVQLYTGRSNIVPYLGLAQTVQDTFASIIAFVTDYYYFNNATQLWEKTPTMVPGGVYYVYVSQNCMWSFVQPELSIPANLIKDADYYVKIATGNTGTVPQSAHYVIEIVKPSGTKVSIDSSTVKSFPPGELVIISTSAFKADQVGDYLANIFLIGD